MPAQSDYSGVTGWRSAIRSRSIPAWLRRVLLRLLTRSPRRDVPLEVLVPPAPAPAGGSAPSGAVSPPRPPTASVPTSPLPVPAKPPTVAELPGLTTYPAARKYVDLVIREATARGVPPAIVLATMAAESAFNERAYRAEPHINDASRGLMQLLYRTAQGLGYNGTPDGLYVPAVNIALGTQYLADGLELKKGDVWAAVSRYNNGNGRRVTKPTTTCLWRRADKTCGETFTAQPGQFLNQPYVDRVQGFARTFGYVDGMPIAEASLGGGPVVVLLLLGALARRWLT